MKIILIFKKWVRKVLHKMKLDIFRHIQSFIGRVLVAKLPNCKSNSSLIRSVELNLKIFTFNFVSASFILGIIA